MCLEDGWVWLRVALLLEYVARHCSAVMTVLPGRQAAQCIITMFSTAPGQSSALLLLAPNAMDNTTA